MYLIPISAFANDYPGLLNDSEHPRGVDPGDTAPKLSALEVKSWRLESILVRRRHAALTELAHPPSRRISRRNQNYPTLPTFIAPELLVNPFLRTRQATIIAAAHRPDSSAHDDNTVFAAIRRWKNKFR